MRDWERRELELRRKRLCKGLHAELIPHDVGYKLVLTKDGEPYFGFSIGATRDWMSGNFSIEGEIVMQWDRGRRMKPGLSDNWHSRASAFVEMVNRCSEVPNASHTG